MTENIVKCSKCDEVIENGDEDILIVEVGSIDTVNSDFPYLDISERKWIGHKDCFNDILGVSL